MRRPTKATSRALFLPPIARSTCRIARQLGLRANLAGADFRNASLTARACLPARPLEGCATVLLAWQHNPGTVPSGTIRVIPSDMRTMAVAKKPSGHRKPRPRAVQSVDALVGTKLRFRRTLLGISQEKLAASVGITFQQVQKYENGSNRISSGRLHDFSKFLGVPPSFFFEGLDDGMVVQPATTARDGIAPDAGSCDPADILLRRETLELVRAYARIPQAETRKKIRELIKSLAGGLDEPQVARKRNRT